MQVDHFCIAKTSDHSLYFLVKKPRKESVYKKPQAASAF